MKITVSSRDRMEQEISAALEQCNLCEETLEITLPDGFWGDEFEDIVDSFMPEIEAHIERGGGYMMDDRLFSVTGQDCYHVRSRFVLK